MLKLRWLVDGYGGSRLQYLDWNKPEGFNWVDVPSEIDTTLRPAATPNLSCDCQQLNRISITGGWLCPVHGQRL